MQRQAFIRSTPRAVSTACTAAGSHPTLADLWARRSASPPLQHLSSTAGPKPCAVARPHGHAAPSPADSFARRQPLRRGRRPALSCGKNT